MFVLLCPDSSYCVGKQGITSQKIIGRFSGLSCRFILMYSLLFNPLFHHLPWPFSQFYFTPCWLILLSKCLGSTVLSSEELSRVLNPVPQDSILISMHRHLSHLMSCFPWSTLWIHVLMYPSSLAALYHLGCVGPSALLRYSCSPPLVGPALPLLGYDKSWQNYWSGGHEDKWSWILGRGILSCKA